MNKEQIRTVFLRSSPGDKGKWLRAYHVGLNGCTAIESVYHGEDEEGMPMYSYRIHFGDGTVIEGLDVWLAWVER